MIREYFFHSECGKKRAYVRNRVHPNGYYNGTEWYCSYCRVVLDPRVVEADNSHHPVEACGHCWSEARGLPGSEPERSRYVVIVCDNCDELWPCRTVAQGKPPP